MRELDDKIVYALNVSIPTESFKHKSDMTNTCGDLRSKIEQNYDVRNKAIKECIAITADRVKTLKIERDTKQNDSNVDKSFRLEQRKVNWSTKQTKNRHKFHIWIDHIFIWTAHIFLIILLQLRMLQSELNVEDIIKDRTLKILHERCARFWYTWRVTGTFVVAVTQTEANFSTA